MTIIDFQATIEEYARWHAAKFDRKNVRNVKLGYLTTNVNAAPPSSNPTVTVNPTIAKASSVQILRNNTSVSQVQTVAFSETTTDTQSSTTTKGCKFSTTVSASSKFKVDVKFLMVNSSVEQTVGVSTTAEYNYSSSQTRTQTTSKVWTVTQPVTVPPFKQVSCSLLIYDAPYTIPIDLNCHIVSNYSSQWGKCLGTYNSTDAQGQTWLSAISVGNLMSWPGKPPEFVGVVASNPNQPNDRDTLVFKGIGTQSALTGLYSIVDFVEKPLPGYDGEIRTYQLPAQLVNENDIILPESTSIPIINPITSSLNDFIV
ncbi:ETX/MTX2 family pore-forming toxin [Bacillus toyonensis]|uniref:Uncharacterized protein n=1 Tax=Bacillus toyonensis TaxID=155322 RepID=A0A2B5APP9_9BACI|nr:ETX/MTX2 family pore-forming toxin [Bacillus toyonensis]PEK74087.1 hypothetical protein CN594_33290 [Bacillus toyonensis]PFY28433.1 hypothetical protein COL55_34995 [Bacillus toyonensis]PFY39443.1 hypothetical protein COL54_20400 [Bacillus toyonensis]PFY66992.1 hypothetical protein COL62_27585 [Bacillus toyonensis]PGD05680.1 hypothetical protein COM37_33260 [Bacillus toyonensis]